MSPSPDVSAALGTAGPLIAVMMLVAILFGIPLYLLPTIIALMRRNRIAETLVINLFLGMDACRMGLRHGDGGE